MNLTDESLMPFGKFRGEKMGNVPAAYLVWLGDQIKPIAFNKRTLAQKAVLNYITENEDVIKSELKNDKTN